MENPFDKYDTPQTASANPFDKYDVVAPAADPTFFESIGNDWSKRIENVKNSGLKTGGAQSFYAAGQLAGGVMDVPMNILSKLTPDYMKEGFKNVVGEYGAMAKPLIDALPSLPEGVGKGVETAANVLSLVPPGWAASKLATRGSNAVIDPIRATAKVDEMMDKAIVNGYTKGIKPSVVGKSDAGLVRKANDNAKTAIKDIVNSVDTPLSQSANVLEDFSNAVSTTKKKIWGDVQKLSTEAGEQGAKVDMLPVLNDMETVSADALLQAADPGISSTLKPYIDAWKNLIEQKGRYVSPSEAEDIIAGLNAKAKPFWKDPNSHSTAAAVERIAQNLRKQTFGAMEGLEGDAYAGLRKRYGAQLAIEKEVTDRATVTGRRNEFGFFDLGNMMAASEFVGALASGNPLGIAKAGGILTAKSVMKAKNDPSKIIRKMFKDVETLNAIKNRKVFPDAINPPPPTAPDISGIRPTPLGLPMPERGFVTQGQPYGDVLRPNRPQSNVMDAEFTSRPMGFLTEPRRDPTLQLPQFTGSPYAGMGQNFTTPQGTPFLPQRATAIRPELTPEQLSEYFKTSKGLMR